MILRSLTAPEKAQVFFPFNRRYLLTEFHIRRVDVISVVGFTVHEPAQRLPESAGNRDSVSWPKALSIRVSRLRSDSNGLICVAGICRNGAGKRRVLLVPFTSPGLKGSGRRMGRPYRASGIGVFDDLGRWPRLVWSTPLALKAAGGSMRNGLAF